MYMYFDYKVLDSLIGLPFQSMNRFKKAKTFGWLPLFFISLLCFTSDNCNFFVCE